MSRSAKEQDSAKSRGRPEGLPKRWSAQRKAEVVLRLLRGEDIGEVSREIRVAPPELERWRWEFLDGGKQGLKASPFLGEGHRKVKARLAAKGIRVGKNRVLRLMREHGLLAPVRRGHPRGDRTHSGRIRTERPNELWGTDASRFWTKAEGWCWFFAAVDHCASECNGVAGALHPDAQGGVHLSAPLRNPRGGQSGDRGLRQVLQQRLAPAAARVHDPGPGPREAQPEGGMMFKPSTCPENRNRYTLLN